MTAHDDPARDEQPAPAGDDELREAERLPSTAEEIVKAHKGDAMAIASELVATRIAMNAWRDEAEVDRRAADGMERQLDERGRELERAQAEVIRLRARVAELEQIEKRASSLLRDARHVGDSHYAGAARYILGRSS